MGAEVLRAIAAGLLGILLAVLLIAGLEALSHWVFPVPATANGALANPHSLGREDSARIFAGIPLGAKVSVIVSWAIGAFAGAALALRIAAGLRWPGYVPPGFVLIAAGATMMAIPHPWWMVVSAVMAIPLAGLLAIRLFARPPRKTGALPGPS